MSDSPVVPARAGATRIQAEHIWLVLLGAGVLLAAAAPSRPIANDHSGATARMQHRVKVDSSDVHGTRPAISPADLRMRLFAFAHDSMRGRAGGTPDNLRATAYIARELRRLGLTPAGDRGSYFQDVPLYLRWISPRSRVRVGDRDFPLGTHFIPRDNRWAPLSLTGMQTVYAGPATDGAFTLDSAAVAGRAVVVSAPNGWRVNRARLSARYATAAVIIAVALEQIPHDLRGEFLAERSVRLQPAPGDERRPAFLFVSSALARAMFGGADPSSLAVGTVGERLSGQLSFESIARPARNVVAVIRGADPRRRGQYVAIGAHSDHEPPQTTAVDHDSLRAFNQVARVGGAEGNEEERPLSDAQRERIRALLDSMRALRPARPDSIRNGADDDGSGSMALLEIAEAVVRLRERPARSLLFVWHTGEELGMLGSQYYTEHPTVPLDSVVAMLNVDMIGRGTAQDVVRVTDGRAVPGGPDYLALVGARRRSRALGDLIEAVNARQPAPFALDYAFDRAGEEHEYYCRSDHYMYARFGVPVSFFFTGGHADYHQVTDEAQYIVYPKYARVVRLLHDVTLLLANRDRRPVADQPAQDRGATCRQ